jgi:hypothetical protein
MHCNRETNNVSTELLPGNGLCTVACRHGYYVAISLHVILLKLIFITSHTLKTAFVSLCMYFEEQDQKTLQQTSVLLSRDCIVRTHYSCMPFYVARRVRSFSYDDMPNDIISSAVWYSPSFLPWPFPAECAVDLFECNDWESDCSIRVVVHKRALLTVRNIPLTVTVVSLWGALCDERWGLSLAVKVCSI